MCDYSLHHLRSRPAKVDDKLTVSDFGHPLGTRGFAASEDKYLAVCLLPGTELSFENEVRRESNWVPWSTKIKHKTAIFRQVNKKGSRPQFFNYRRRLALRSGNRKSKLLSRRITLKTPQLASSKGRRRPAREGLWRSKSARSICP
jgi:hypothetical protein